MADAALYSTRTAAPGRHASLLAKARDADPAHGADGDLPLLLAAGPAREAILRLVGMGGLGALMATRRALQRDVRELAAEVAWREGERVNEDGDAMFRVRPAHVAEWAARFPGARALAVNKRGNDACARCERCDGRGRHAEARGA